MSRTITVIFGLMLSAALAAACFILSGSPQENLFYIGTGFGLASILVFSMSINSLAAHGKKQVKGDGEK